MQTAWHQSLGFNLAIISYKYRKIFGWPLPWSPQFHPTPPQAPPHSSTPPLLMLRVGVPFCESSWRFSASWSVVGQDKDHHQWPPWWPPSGFVVEFHLCYCLTTWPWVSHVSFLSPVSSSTTWGYYDLGPGIVLKIKCMHVTEHLLVVGTSPPGGSDMSALT